MNKKSERDLIPGIVETHDGLGEDSNDEEQEYERAPRTISSAGEPASDEVSDADLSEDEDDDSDSVYDSEDFIGEDDIHEIVDEEPLSDDNVSKFINLAELSDSSEEDEAPLVRVGNVPREWYDDLDHLGYNVDGVPIARKVSGMDQIDEFLAMRDDGEFRRSVYDPLHDRNVVLSAKDLEMIHRLRHGTYADSSFDPEDTPYLQAPKQKHPIAGNHYNPPKRAFVPSKYENQRVLYLVKALRNGWIRPRAEREQEESGQQPQISDIWSDNHASVDKSAGPPFIPAPKLKTPGHAESYNPPEEYLPDEQELEKWAELDAEDRPHNFIPKKYTAMRKVPAYPKFIKERFERSLDLYLCPRAMRKRLQIDPESLIPKLPNPASLKPFPTFECIEFLGHSARVQSLAVSSCGEWLASGDDEGCVRVWEVDSGRCVKEHVFRDEEDSSIRKLEWNPKQKELLGIATANRLVLWNVFESAFRLKESTSASVKLHATEKESESGHTLSSIELLDGPIHGFSWHRSGDFVATFRSNESSKSAVMVHKLSSGESQQPFSKSKGMVQAICFHPSRPLFFVATKAHVRIYDLAKQALVKKLKTPMKWISSMDIHPQTGDHLIVGSYDRRVCWFDLDLSSSAFKTMKYHKAAVRAVKYHKSFPLFLSASDDGNTHVFHGRVFNDLMTDPEIVPVKILRSHEADSQGLGVLNAVWHPSQPWLFTSGADGCVKMFC